MKFSDVIKDAKGKGFTEPDPRDDLSGTDVARKVLLGTATRTDGIGMRSISVCSRALLTMALLTNPN